MCIWEMATFPGTKLQGTNDARGSRRCLFWQRRVVISERPLPDESAIINRALCAGHVLPSLCLHQVSPRGPRDSRSATLSARAGAPPVLFVRATPTSFSTRRAAINRTSQTQVLSFETRRITVAFLHAILFGAVAEPDSRFASHVIFLLASVFEIKS